jgi:hypothetical protein
MKKKEEEGTRDNDNDGPMHKAQALSGTIERGNVFNRARRRD